MREILKSTPIKWISLFRSVPELSTKLSIIHFISVSFAPETRNIMLGRKSDFKFNRVPSLDLNTFGKSLGIKVTCSSFFGIMFFHAITFVTGHFLLRCER